MRDDVKVGPSVDDLVAQLVAAGGREYPDTIDPHAKRLVQFPMDGTHCTLNEKPPRLNVYVWRDFRSHELGVEFEVCGTRGNRGPWLSARLYSVQRHEAMAMLPHARRALSAVWEAYCKVEVPRE